ncbi:uncharacterized protein MEPE_02470 [Melanopsichium pennsylvanicum]|uniref:Uncharacterized protein n=2 Tax=Melanopsichium pennsylvanicum TaxID=63383 RepID=A0AAJ5C4K8_9BASI|nr:conserved hypothetical protein [Melanopsichium pennsylvanicum 4]SNX83762.1 uncharacterized protein MEPE_02470 [Melanopsichium pennsylvanicum]
MDSRQDMASFGSSPNSTNPNNGTRLPGLAGTESEKQLTPRELGALRTIKRNVDATKYGGWMLGAAGTYVLISRRTPPPRLLSRLGWSVVGGLGGSFLTMPIGILLSRNVLKDVEDPQHLRRVLAGAMEEQRQGRRPQIGVSGGKGLNGEQPAEFGQQQAQDQGEWGSEKSAQNYGGFDKNGNSTAADSFDSFTSTQPSSDARSSSGGIGARSASTEPSPTTRPPDGTGAGTRWSQLRGERGVEPSKWERIRQDNARTAYSRTSASSSSQSQPNSVNPSQSAPSSRSKPVRSDEPVMTLSGSDDDPRWSSPATFSPQSSGWGNGEFVDDPAASRNNSSAKRGYGILSVLEDDPSKSSAYQLESDAPIQVVKGSLLASLVGGVSGSIYGVLKGRQGAGTVLGTRMAFSSFAFAFPFFAVREYIMAPVLNRTNSGPDPKNRHMRLKEVSRNKHTDKLVASGLAGAVVGAGAAGFTRGAGAVHKGFVTFGAACTGLQLVGNELRVARDTLIRPSPRRIPVPESMITSANPGSSDAAVSAATATSPLIDINPNHTQKVQENPEENKTGKSWLNKVRSAMPIRSVSDQEYEDELKGRLSGVNQRMADVEMEIKEIEQMLKQHEQSNPASV